MIHIYTSIKNDITKFVEKILKENNGELMEIREDYLIKDYVIKTEEK